MGVYRFQIAWGGDTAFPRDRVTINPHFSVSGPLVNEQTLTDDLKTAIAAWTGASREITVKCYDAQADPPNFPKAASYSNLGTNPASSVPREVACCLSFRGALNVPRQRGRLYVPTFVHSSSVAGVPSATQMDKVAALVPIFTGLGGVDVDWCVYSRVNDQPYSVAAWHVDNEWDTVRSRGLRSTARNTGAVGE
jgi:hypothetical protein